MSISQKIEKYFKNQIKMIKTEKNPLTKKKMVGALVSDVGGRCISAIANAINACRNYVKKCGEIVRNNLPILSSKNKCGRNKYEENHPEIVIYIKEICTNSEFVDKSLKDNITYIDVSAKYIINELKNKYNYDDKDCPCENTIIRILREKLEYKITKVKKNKVQKKIKETDEIFNNVNLKKEELYKSDENTIGISIDDKVAKYVGELSGNGSSWIERNALDHDTNPDYIVKPFGIMDLKTKEVKLYCTTSNSTADFKVDSIEEYLKQKLKINPNINKLMIFLDNGPENGSSRKLWKYRIIKLAIKYNIQQIELVYYPPYHSKYNMIEHYWGVLQRHWNGLIIDNLDKLIGAINSCTWSGINSKGYLSTTVYEKGRNIDVAELAELEKNHITYNNQNIKKWSLIITP